MDLFDYFGLPPEDRLQEEDVQHEEEEGEDVQHDDDREELERLGVNFEEDATVDEVYEGFDMVETEEDDADEYMKDFYDDYYDDLYDGYDDDWPDEDLYEDDEDLW